MSDQRFLSLVRRKGRYATSGEASRAANAVFGTIKSWVSPVASSEIRKILPQDAASLWQYSPVSVWSDLSHLWKDMEFSHLILRVQQLGRYETSEEARMAYSAVMGALKTLFPMGTDMIIGKPLPVDTGAMAKPASETVAVA
ncbi:MAG: DUF2267 domain-containing protein [Thermoleophilia bacterium]